MPAKITARKIINLGPALKLGYGYTIPSNSECLISNKCYSNFSFVLDRKNEIKVIGYTGSFNESFRIVKRIKKTKRVIKKTSVEPKKVSKKKKEEPVIVEENLVLETVEIKDKD